MTRSLAITMDELFADKQTAVAQGYGGRIMQRDPSAADLAQPNSFFLWDECGILVTVQSKNVHVTGGYR